MISGAVSLITLVGSLVLSNFRDFAILAGWVVIAFGVYFVLRINPKDTPKDKPEIKKSVDKSDKTKIASDPDHEGDDFGRPSFFKQRENPDHAPVKEAKKVYKDMPETK